MAAARASGGSSTTVSSSSSKSKKILFWSPECRYDVILNVVKQRGWKLSDDEKNENKVNMYWIDIATIQERFRTIQPWQMINHFPGMPNIARKNRMGQNLNKMQKVFPREYSFYPRTWVLPAEMADFRQNFDPQGNAIGGKIFIIKPDAGCQGRGIFLTRTWDLVPQQENVVAQTYIKKPLLLDGFKFDLRIYVLVTCIKPLRMYLFHDGLVRMCTEEYVKPTKQNISQTCMHLTNYAVNKHNSNFQQPSAKSSEDRQDEGSKRSVHWFMNWMREQHGDAKADWLWGRIGILCVRTLLSILPILSREYDQHFKSFNNVPVQFSTPQQQQAPAPAAPSTRKPSAGSQQSASNNNKASAASSSSSSSSSSSLSSKKSVGGGASKARRTEAGNDGNESDEEDGEGEGDGEGDGDEEEEDGEGDEEDEAEEEDVDKENGVSEDAKGRQKKEGSRPSSSSEEDKPAASESEEQQKKNANREPQTRGCRCFEVLGYDIMIDASLKPWLIEVNHLPSFGTDSPLDRDIKDRLMQQVFKVLPVRADDEQAYMMHHKSEAGKRLTGRTSKRFEDETDSRQSSMRDSGRDSSTSRPPTDRSRNSEASSGNGSAKTGGRKSSEESTPQVEAESSVSALPNVNGGAEEHAAGYLDDEPVTPERLQEIIDTLTEIYLEHSPEKINKIGRLLQKYTGREEEFLRFVYHKYNITPKLTQKQLAAAAAAAEAAEAAKKKVGPPMGMSPKPPNGANTKGKPSGGARDRFSRSLSPPATNRRAPAVWRCAGAEEDLPFRNDVLALHWPAEDDVWLQKEQRLLTQFTRIFPKLPKTANEAENEEGEDEERDADEEGVVASSTLSSVAGSSTGTESTSGKFKPASYEDIIVQAFIIDKRQTMRLHQPLQARMRPSSQEELPPLDSKSLAPLPGGIGTNSKGVVGWRAPAQKPSEKKEARVPTQSQLDAAKRLSLGLSVARDGVTIIQPRASKYAGLSPSVVLDPDDVASLAGQQQPISGGLSQGSIHSQMQMQYPPQPAGGGGNGDVPGIVVWSGVPGSEGRQFVQNHGQPPQGLQTQSMYQPQQQQQMLQQQQQQQQLYQQQQQYQQQQYQQYQQSLPPPHASSSSASVGYGSAQAHPSQGYGHTNHASQGQGQGFSHLHTHNPNSYPQANLAAMGSGLNITGNLGSIAAQRARLVEEGRQTRMRLELARVTPAAVLRQQVYRFVPTDLNPNPAAGFGLMQGMPPLGADGGSAPGPGGGAPSSGGILGGPPFSGNGLPGQPNHMTPSFAQHVQQQKQQKAGVRGAGPPSAASKNYGNVDHPQDVLLRELFPGWF